MKIITSYKHHIVSQLIKEADWVDDPYLQPSFCFCSSSINKRSDFALNVLVLWLYWETNTSPVCKNLQTLLCWWASFAHFIPGLYQTSFAWFKFKIILLSLPGSWCSHIVAPLLVLFSCPSQTESGLQTPCRGWRGGVGNLLWFASCLGAWCLTLTSLRILGKGRGQC